MRLKNTLSDQEKQINAQEKLILSLRAQLAETKTRCANLQRMHDSD
jgi:uncharacterized coiled-coil protein SlyX